MKKVGIVTFHSTNNYGAALQCYALQKALEKINFDSYVINYTADMLKRPYGMTALKEKGIVRFILGNIYFLLRSFRNRNFSAFREKIKQTGVINPDDLQKLNDEFDCFITGSDQVWNGSITSYDPVYFLRFVDDEHKRKSYAASFGMDRIPQDKKELYKRLLDKFSVYNVREESGKEIIKDLLGEVVNQTIDPTLLLCRNEWECVAKNQVKNDKYIFVYQISPSRHLPIIVNELRKKTFFLQILIFIVS